MVESMHVESAIKLIIAAHDIPEPPPASADDEGNLPTGRPSACSGS